MNCEAIFNSSQYVNKLESDIVYLTAQEQRQLLHFKQLECHCRMKTKPVVLDGLYCNRTWDDIMCWDDTLAGVTVSQPCPGYINSFQKQNFATRRCLDDGTWFSINKTKSNGWTNYTACLTSSEVDDGDVPFMISRHLRDLRLMYNIGYTLSLISLFVAFLIMIYFKKLHCSRNTIHLNLFASFMLRASISLIRDNFIVEGLGFPGDVTINTTAGIVVFNDGTHWECRLFFSIFQYFIAASYVWIFVEAVYLHMFIFVSVFTEKLKVWWFCVFGWLFPLAIVACWCFARYHLDNTYCWNLHNEKPGLVWILQGPIMVTIILNLVFFVNMVRVLHTKLQAPTCPNSKRTRLRQLARSTLFLVPAFGVYFIFFTLPLHNLSDTMAFVMLFIEMFFNSFQGFFIALVLCFISHEVRIEIQRAWRKMAASSTLSCLRHSRDDLRSTNSRLHGQSRVEVGERLIKLEEMPPGKQQQKEENGNLIVHTDRQEFQDIG